MDIGNIPCNTFARPETPPRDNPSLNAIVPIPKEQIILPTTIKKVSLICFIHITPLIYYVVLLYMR